MLHGGKPPGGVHWIEWTMLAALVLGFAGFLWQGARRAPVVDEARRMKSELWEIDRAVRPLNDGSRTSSRRIEPAEYLPLVREKFRRLREQGSDPFGNPYPAIPDGGRIQVPAATGEALAGYLDASFWSPFAIEPKDTVPPGETSQPPPEPEPAPPDDPD